MTCTFKPFYFTTLDAGCLQGFYEHCGVFVYLTVLLHFQCLRDNPDYIKRFMM